MDTSISITQLQPNTQLTPAQRAVIEAMATVAPGVDFEWFSSADSSGCWRCGRKSFYRDGYGAIRCSNCGASQ